MLIPINICVTFAARTAEDSHTAGRGGFCRDLCGEVRCPNDAQSEAVQRCLGVVISTFTDFAGLAMRSAADLSFI